MSENIQNIIDLSISVRDVLIASGFTLATAESCTGGWIAKLITDLPGSSACFEASVVSYSNASKQSLLGVQKAVLDDRGAVSQQTVVAMVEGLFERTRADVAVSVSGIAGPSGGTEEKPVGTVWIGSGLRDRPVIARSYHFDGDREAVRLQSVEAAFNAVLAIVADRLNHRDV